MIQKLDRPEIRLDAHGVYMLNGVLCKVVIREDSIRVGCTTITIEAAKALMKVHEEKFPTIPKVYVIQEGSIQ